MFITRVCMYVCVCVCVCVCDFIQEHGANIPQASSSSPRGQSSIPSQTSSVDRQSPDTPLHSYIFGWHGLAQIEARNYNGENKRIWQLTSI